MNRFVISDIHGCYDTFCALISKINLKKEDQLYLLGDYIDRGPHSAKVIDYILELMDNGYQLYPLRGNHEQNMLFAEKEYDFKTFVHFVEKINKSADLIHEGRLIDKYRQFFESLPLYYLLPDYILVHAGLNFLIDNPLEDKNALMEIRKFEIPASHPLTANRVVVHGHVPTYFESIEGALRSSSKIPLDNGCVYSKAHKIYDYKRLGNLLCLDLDRKKLIVQKNIET